MLNRSTVVVVGAGCSKEFGLPIGSELIDGIYQRLDSEKELTVGSLHHAVLQSGLNSDLDRRIAAFRDGVHSKPSIDQYLEYHNSNAEVVQIGKIAIVYELLAAENRSLLAAHSGKRNHLKFKNVWLLHLYHLLCESLSTDTIETIFNNITFICFNYDRCIEEMLFYLISTQTHLNAEHVQQIMRSLKIIHPYGAIAPLPWQDHNRGEEVEFGDCSHLSQMASRIWKNIKTYSESVDAGLRGKIAQSLLESETIIFAGFSFGEQNLKLFSTTALPAPKTILANTYGIESDEYIYIEKNIRNALNLNSVSTFRSCPETARDMFVKNFRLIRG